MGFNWVFFCFFLCLFNIYNKLEVINSVDEVLIIIVNIIGNVKLVIVFLLNIVMGSKVNKVVNDVNIVWFKVLFIVLLIVFFRGWVGFSCNSLCIWFNIIILLLIE